MAGPLTHDDLCPLPPPIHETWRDRYCQCELIDKVRADERVKVATPGQPMRLPGLDRDELLEAGAMAQRIVDLHNPLKDLRYEQAARVLDAVEPLIRADERAAIMARGPACG